MSNESILEKLYSKIKVLKEKAEEDCKFDRTDLDSAFNNTNKLIYWINLKFEWLKVQKDFERQRKDLYRKTYEFYQTDYPLKLSTKEEITLFIESDPGYQPIYMICAVVKDGIQYIESVVELLKSRAWEVKTALEWEKYKNGV